MIWLQYSKNDETDEKRDQDRDRSGKKEEKYRRVHDAIKCFTNPPTFYHMTQKLIDKKICLCGMEVAMTENTMGMFCKNMHKVCNTQLSTDRQTNK